MRFIPAVVVIDLLWLVVVMGLRHYAPTTLTRRLLTVMVVYVALETTCHWYMEEAAGWAMRLAAGQ